MGGSLASRVFALLLAAVYLAAAVATFASSCAICPALAQASHAGLLDHNSRGHDHRSGAKPDGDVDCCLATCLLGVSLPVSMKLESSPASPASIVTYWSRIAVLP